MSAETSKFQNDLEFLKIQYQILSERRINHNTLLWNVPSILFVAQAFLWTLALNNDNHWIIRCAISALSVVIAYVVYQTFERNRLMEVIDAEQMYSIEEYIKSRDSSTDTFTSPIMIIHHKIDKRNLIDGRYEMVSDFLNYHGYYKHHNKKKSICKQASSALWKVVFFLFFALSCIILLYNITQIPTVLAMLQQIKIR